MGNDETVLLSHEEPVPDSKSGLFCAYNAGTTVVDDQGRRLVGVADRHGRGRKREATLRHPAGERSAGRRTAGGRAGAGAGTRTNTGEGPPASAPPAVPLPAPPAPAAAPAHPPAHPAPAPQHPFLLAPAPSAACCRSCRCPYRRLHVRLLRRGRLPSPPRSRRPNAKRRSRRRRSRSATRRSPIARPNMSPRPPICWESSCSPRSPAPRSDADLAVGGVRCRSRWPRSERSARSAGGATADRCRAIGTFSSRALHRLATASMGRSSTVCGPAATGGHR